MNISVVFFFSSLYYMTVCDKWRSYEKSNTHRFEVPRMLFDDPEQLGRYIVDSNDA